ncbi:hypothetical protein HGI47_14430 [Novosphingobium sp. ERN07]|uniref:hypothetical protein n=1 Tax=Novosphingobium sp. ERN07 TaxID=2726187 RepID=UPI0014570940|nr:hypothetical protein [Novosphingobium sp. ERN07]NLR72069.1 hypothetical protein [Novosphingobium sp. ERN07]
MGIFFVSDERHRRLQHFRRRTWLLISLCMFARGTDAAFGLGLIEPTHQFAAQVVSACSAETEFPI